MLSAIKTRGGRRMTVNVCAHIHVTHVRDFGQMFDNWCIREVVNDTQKKSLGSVKTSPIQFSPVLSNPV